MKKILSGIVGVLSVIVLVSISLGQNSGEATSAAEGVDGEHASQDLTIMSYNIAHGQGTDTGEVDLERIAGVIEAAGADVVGIQEVDRFYSSRSDYEDQALVLAELLGFHYVYGANLDLAPHEGYEARQYGNAILSRYPIIDSENIPLESFGREQRGVLRATIDVNGYEMNVYNTHLSLPDADRLAQAKEIVELTSQYSGPKFVMGDMNSEPDFEDLQYLLAEGNFTDTFDGIENANTFRADDPIKRIDYILTSPSVTFANQEVIQTLASDHLPIVIDATIPEVGTINLTKVDSDDSDVVLEGAVFDLQDSDGQVVQSGLVTDENGQLTIEQVLPGDYQLVETAAPQYYDLNTSPLPLTVGKGHIGEVTAINEIKTGSVELTVVDADDETTPLAQAEFELQDGDGAVLLTDLQTDDEGKLVVDDLKPGDYQFIQTKASPYHNIIADPVLFTIDKGQTDALQLTILNEVKLGVAELIAVNQKNMSVIYDGVYQLVDKNGTVLEEGITPERSGKVVVGDLRPGTYAFEMTEAPDRYKQHRKTISFTIENDHQGEPTVTVIGLKEDKSNGKPGKPDHAGKPGKPDHAGKPGKPDHAN